MCIIFQGSVSNTGFIKVYNQWENEIDYILGDNAD